MICPLCGFEQSDDSVECIKCGIIFQRYATHGEAARKDGVRARNPSVKGRESNQFDLLDRLRELSLFIEPEVNMFSFGGRVILYLVLFIYCLIFVFTSMENSHTLMPFMHLVNLPFHEAGHIVFMPFGRFIMFLGGTLGQLLMPLVCMGTLLITRRDTFGGSASLWWFGQNFTDIAPYINDARALELMLIGGVTGREVEGHDWENILGTLGWLRYDHLIAHMSYAVGIVLMVVSLIWGGYILHGQWKNVDRLRTPV
jgi:hypothetical protein